MIMRKNVLALVSMLAIGGAVGGAAVARADGPDIIGIRKAGMDLVFAVVGDMKRSVEAGADVMPLADNATAIARWAKQIPAAFPEGSDKGQDTAALPAIWSDRAGFEKASTALEVAAGKLAEAAKAGDKAAFAEAFKATGAACGGCHKAYRVKKS